MHKYQFLKIEKPQVQNGSHKMILQIMGEYVNMTDMQYIRECAKIFNEMDAIDAKKLTMQLLVLEDTETELLDGYESDWPKRNKKRSKNWTEYLLNIWRTRKMIDHINARISIKNINFGIMPVCPNYFNNLNKHANQQDDDMINSIMTKIKGVSML